MTIKAKMVIIALFLLGFVISGYTLRSVQAPKLDRIFASVESSTLLVQGVFQLYVLTNEFIDTEGARPKEQWLTLHEQLGALLDEVPLSSEAEALSVQRMRESHTSSRAAFERLTKEVDRDVPNALAKERLAAALSLELQGLITHASAISEENFVQWYAMRETLRTLITFFLVALLVFFIFAMVFLYRAVVVPLAHLRRGAESIGEGNLDFRLGLEQRDEFGTLAATFDGMSAKLKESRAALEEKVQELRMVDERKNAFIAILSHELRNPLAPIVNTVDAARHVKVQDPEVQAMFGVIGRNANKLRLLLGDLLDVSRMIRGSIELHPEPIEIGESIRHSVETVIGALERKEQHLRIKEHRPLIVSADPLRLEQIITNVLQNAIKFTGKGGSIAIEVVGESERVCIRITDSGVGIDRADMPHIFTMFYRTKDFLTHTSSVDGEGHDGFGIGLALSRELARLHGGDITAESAGPGKGSAFTVSLPRR